MSLNPIAYILALATVVVIVTVPVTQVSKDFVPPTPSPTIPPVGEDCGVLRACKFNSGDLAEYTLYPGFEDELPFIAEYGILPDFPIESAPPDTNGFYLDMPPEFPFEYNMQLGRAAQNNDISSFVGQPYVLSASIVVAPATPIDDGGMAFTIEFLDGAGAPVENVQCASMVIYGPNFAVPLIYSGSYYRWNVFGQFASDVFVENPQYPVFRKIDNPNVFFMYDATNDQWLGFDSITYDITDLEDGFNLGTDGVNYDGQVIFEFGQFLNVLLGGVFCPQSQFNQQFIGAVPLIYSQGISYTDEGDPLTKTKTFVDYQLTGRTVPAGAVSVNTTVAYFSDTGSPRFVVDNVKLEIL